MNLKDKADTVDESQAIDALNVMFTRTGSVEQRPGYAVFTDSALTNQPDSIASYTTTAGTEYVVVGNGNRLDSLDSSGVSQANAAPTASPHYFARYAAPGAADLYCANGTDEIRRLNGTTFSTPDYEDETNTDVAPKAKFVAVQLPDNRLVAAEHTNSTGFTTANNQDAVRFSDEGDPTTWTQDNYVLLSPGDGEPIMGMIQWRELLFVFKKTKYFVFFGNSTDASGGPIFNYRSVTANAGLASSRALCAGTDGVYFMDQHGIYRTTGGEPTLVSDNVDPIFFGGTSAFYQGGTLLQTKITNSAMTWHDERIYFAFTTTGTTNNRMLVYDIRYGWWSLYDIAASCLMPHDSDGHHLMFGYAAGDNEIAEHESSQTSDAGTAISSRFQSGWFDLGSRDIKTVRQFRLVGEGKVECGNAVDYATSPQTGFQQLDFTATQPLVGTAVVGTDVVGPISSHQFEFNRDATRGTVFSFMLQNDELNQGFTVHRVDQYIRSVESPGRKAVAA